MNKPARIPRTVLPLTPGDYLLDAADEFVFTCTNDFRIIHANRRFLDTFGTAGERCHVVVFGMETPCPWCPALQDGKERAEVRSPRNGRWYRVSARRVAGSDGQDTLAAACRDITREKETERERDLYFTLLSQANDAIFLVEAETARVLYANDRACERLGYGAEEFRELRVTDIGVNVPDLDAWGELKGRLEREGFDRFETFQRRKDGSLLPVEINVRRVEFMGSWYFVSVARDITEQTRMLNALEAEKSKLEGMIDGIGEGVAIIDTSFRVVFQNPVHRARQGNRLGENCYRAFHGREAVCDGCQVEMVFRDGRIHRRSTSAENAGKLIHLEVSATPVRDAKGNILAAFEVVRDLTEQKRMEEELVKAQRLESLALLAGGIAHDFNNLLTVILGDISLALHLVPEGEVRQVLAEAERANLRCRQLTDQLLTFAKSGVIDCRAASAAAIIRETVDFILRGSTIGCTLSLPDGLWPVEVDQGQISQVFTNILVNAREAMDGRGTIAIGAANLSGEGEERSVRITISDDGPGIPSEILPRIFDPYFTTKSSGTGLGLATSYAIVHKHGGELQVESAPGAGTTFSILLPAAREAAQPEPQVREQRVFSSAEGARLLLMDDEEGVLLAVKRMFATLGYRVTTCCCGEEALEAYREALQQGERFDLVVLDMTVKGGMGGVEAFRRLKEIDAEVTAILATGYSSAEDLEKNGVQGIAGRLKKPYSMDELKALLAELPR